MSGYLVKPGAGRRFNPGILPGCRMYLAFNVPGVSKVVDMTGNGFDAPFNGLPTWTSDVFGPTMTGWATTIFLQIDPPVQAIGTVYPWWIGGLFTWTAANTNNGYIISQGKNTGTSGLLAVHLNSGTIGGLRYQILDDASTNASFVTANLSLNDGNPHSFLCYSKSASDHRIVIDGVQQATGTVAVGTFTPNRMAVGVLRTSTNASQMRGNIHMVAMGQGALPDPWRFCMDPFEAIREPIGARAGRTTAGLTAAGAIKFPRHLFQTYPVGAF